jgi:hypothetical protein
MISVHNFITSFGFSLYFKITIFGPQFILYFGFTIIFILKKKTMNLKPEKVSITFILIHSNKILITFINRPNKYVQTITI